MLVSRGLEKGHRRTRRAVFTRGLFAVCRWHWHYRPWVLTPFSCQSVQGQHPVFPVRFPRCFVTVFTKIHFARCRCGYPVQRPDVAYSALPGFCFFDEFFFVVGVVKEVLLVPIWEGRFFFVVLVLGHVGFLSFGLDCAALSDIYARVTKLKLDGEDVHEGSRL